MEGNTKLNFIVITGMSGAGKSEASNAFEDMGYFCIDNIPPVLIPSIIDLGMRSGGKLSKIAVTTDLRGGEMFSEINNTLNLIKDRGITPYVLFLDASNEELMRRFKENRRAHPLSSKHNLSVVEAIDKERELLNEIYLNADYSIDTTYISNRQLKQQINDIFVNDIGGQTRIQCMSFGFKHGSPRDADLVFDVRCLPNPYYIDELRDKTGKDKAIADYVFEFPQSKELLNKIQEFFDFTIPLYKEEGKSQLIIAIGCTGGKHRSVLFAECLYKYLSQKGYIVGINHRDIEK